MCPTMILQHYELNNFLLIAKAKIDALIVANIKAITTIFSTSVYVLKNLGMTPEIYQLWQTFECCLITTGSRYIIGSVHHHLLGYCQPRMLRPLWLFLIGHHWVRNFRFFATSLASCWQILTFQGIHVLTSSQQIRRFSLGPSHSGCWRSIFVFPTASPPFTIFRF